MYVCVEARRHGQYMSSVSLCLIALREDLPLNQKFAFWLDWLVSELRIWLSPLNNTEVTEMSRHVQLFTGVLGI